MASPNDPTDTGAGRSGPAPRSLPVFAALAPAAFAGALALALADAASLAAAVRLSPFEWIGPALCGFGVLGFVLARWTRSEPEALAFVRALVVAAVLGLAPLVFARVEPESVRPLLRGFGALLGLLLAPDVAAVHRALGASRAAGETYLFERHGLRRLALASLLTTVLAAAALEAIVGANRALFAGALLLLGWAPLRFSARAGAVVGSLVALGACTGVALAAGPHWTLPMPRTVIEQWLLESLPAPVPGTTVWARPISNGMLLRVQDAGDMTLYESLDERRVADALVHPAATLTKLERVLVIGNEGGGVTRQALRYPEAKEVVHVSLVKGLTRAFRTDRLLRRAHAGALDDPRVRRLEVASPDALKAALAPLGEFSLIAVAATAPFETLRWLLSSDGRASLSAHLAKEGFLVQRLLSVVDSRFPWCFVEEAAGEGLFAMGLRLALPGSTFDEVLLMLASPTRFDGARLRGLRVQAETLDEAQLSAIREFGLDQSFKPRGEAGRCIDEIGVR